MKINFKQPKYVLPLILQPFLCLFFFVYHSGFAAKKTEEKKTNGLNSTVGQISGGHAPGVQACPQRVFACPTAPVINAAT